MFQLEIEFFWPLTEQIKLDLDYTPSEQWIADWRKKQWTNTTSTNLLIGNGIGNTTWTQPSPTTSFVIKPNEVNAGKWEITDNMFVYRPTKPNAVIRFMAKILLGFKWHDDK